MAVILFENMFNILPNSIREKAIKDTKQKVEIDKKEYKENPIKLHGSVSVLIAILYSASYDIPEWCPSLVTYLAKFRSGFGIISSDVTKALSWFKKQHQYDWKYQKEKFTEQQLAVVEDVFDPYNYFS